MMSLWLFLFAIMRITFTLNVLIWNPTIGHSHVRFMGSIADILVEDGHNVTIVSPVMDPHVDMVGHRSAAVLIPYVSKYYDPDDYLNLDIKGPALWDSPRTEGRCFSMDDLEKFMKMTEKLCRGVFEDSKFLTTLRDCSFDVALHEAYELCAVAVLEMIDVKNTVVVSALCVTPYIQEIAGLATNPSFIPGMFTTYSDDMTFWERMDNFKFEIEMYNWRGSWEKIIWKLANKARPNFPNLRKLLKEKTGVVLMNVNEVTESSRPTANILRYIGGAAIHEPKKLNEKLNAILSERRDNVLFSLGSLAQSKDMPLKLKRGRDTEEKPRKLQEKSGLLDFTFKVYEAPNAANEVIDAFAQFPNTTFIWKYEEENDAELFEKQTNIHVMKWIPQVDLLADDRLSLFITHAGMNSVLEATFFGKPMVAIPLFVDQILNAKTMRNRGLAVVIDMHDLCRDTLVSAIYETLRPNSSYVHKAAVVSNYLRGQPAAARAEVSRWVKLVAENGQMNHLVLISRDMSFVKYYCIDILAYLLTQFLLSVIVLYRLLKFVLGHVRILAVKLKAG